MGGQLNKPQVLKLLNEARKDLRLIKQVDIEKIPNEFKDLRELGRNLLQLKGLGYKAIATQEFGLLEEKFHKYREIFETIDNLNENGSFDIFLKETKLQKETVFQPMVETIVDDLQKLREELDRQVSIDGYPLKIIPGKLNIVIAPSHTGKTYHATYIALQAAREGKKVLFVSTEEDKLSFVDRTQTIHITDSVWKNVTFIYRGVFTKREFLNLFKAAEEEEYDYICIDYLKKTMWNEDRGENTIMGEINSTIVEALNQMDRRISVFAYVQGNRATHLEKFKTLDSFIENVDDVPMLVDGGLAPFQNADNLTFLRRFGDQRYIIVAKARRENALGRFQAYDVKSDFTLWKGDLNKNYTQNTLTSNGKKPMNFEEM